MDAIPKNPVGKTDSPFCAPRTPHRPTTAPRKPQPTKAFALTRYGKKDTVKPVLNVHVPDLRGDDVLVQIHATSINPLDLKIRNGELKPLLPYKLPLVLGNDLAGIVVKTGPRVRRFALATRYTPNPTRTASAHRLRCNTSPPSTRTTSPRIPKTVTRTKPRRCRWSA